MATSASFSTKKNATTERRYVPVFLTDKDYFVNKSDVQDDDSVNLAKLSRQYKWIPTIQLVDWLIQETNLVDEKHRLKFHALAFMQEFQFVMYITDFTQQPRLLVGHIITERGVRLEVWAGWPGTKQHPCPSTSAADTVLYNGPTALTMRYILEFRPEAREHIQWLEPFEMLYQMSQIFKGQGLKAAVQVQDAIVLATARVVLRFPGLMKVAPEMGDRLADFDASDHSGFSRRPFDRFDDLTKSPLPENPYQDALDSIKPGPSPTDGFHRCDSPDQQHVYGNMAAKSEYNSLKGKGVDNEELWL